MLISIIITIIINIDVIIMIVIKLMTSHRCWLLSSQSCDSDQSFFFFFSWMEFEWRTRLTGVQTIPGRNSCARTEVGISSFARGIITFARYTRLHACIYREAKNRVCKEWQLRRYYLSLADAFQLSSQISQVHEAEARNILFKSFEAKAYPHFLWQIFNLYYKIKIELWYYITLLLAIKFYAWQ